MIYGLDIGGTKIELAIFDDSLIQQHSWRVGTPKDDYTSFTTAIADMVTQADFLSGNKGSVGIVLPAFVAVSYTHLTLPTKA